jgi:hypothetical protein
MKRIFLLSPAQSRGPRAQIILNPHAGFDLARRLRTPPGAPMGEVFAFLSGLYFRGKLLYALRFAPRLRRAPGVVVITPGFGLCPPERPIDVARLAAFAEVPIDSAEPRYVAPLLRDAEALAKAAPRGTEFVLLGSVASAKYVDPLLEVFGDRLLFPPAFVGRGDMSRGGLLLRCVDVGMELDYVPVRGATRHGPRPPRLPPRVRPRSG